jgi:hypothetical protein
VLSVISVRETAPFLEFVKQKQIAAIHRSTDIAILAEKIYFK